MRRIEFVEAHIKESCDGVVDGVDGHGNVERAGEADEQVENDGHGENNQCAAQGLDGMAERECQRAKEDGDPPIAEPVPQDIEENATIGDFLDDSRGEADDNPNRHLARGLRQALVDCVALADRVVFPNGVHASHEKQERSSTSCGVSPTDSAPRENVTVETDSFAGEEGHQEHEGLNDQGLPEKQ